MKRKVNGRPATAAPKLSVNGSGTQARNASPTAFVKSRLASDPGAPS